MAALENAKAYRIDGARLTLGRTSGSRHARLQARVAGLPTATPARLPAWPPPLPGPAPGLRTLRPRPALRAAADSERGAAVGAVLRPQAAAVRCDDRVRDRETQPQPFRLGRHEGLEDVVHHVGVDAGALVAHREVHEPVVGPHPDGQRGRSRRCRPWPRSRSGSGSTGPAAPRPGRPAPAARRAPAKWWRRRVA